MEVQLGLLFMDVSCCQFDEHPFLGVRQTGSSSNGQASSATPR